jgi:cell division protein FtsB
MLDTLGYYRKTTQFGHGTAYGQVRTLWGIRGISKPVKYECEGGVNQIQLLKNPDTPVGTLKRMIKGIISGKVTIERGETPEVEEIFSALEIKHPKLQGLIKKARNKLPRESAPPPVVAPPPAEGSATRAVSPSMIQGVEDLGEDADTQKTPLRQPVDEDNAKTGIFKPGDSGARTQVQPTPEPKAEEAKLLFQSVTQMLDLTSSEVDALQTPALMGGDYASILGKLTQTAAVLKTRVEQLEAEVRKLRDENKKLPGQILDALQEQFPSLAKQVKALKTLLT